MTPAGTPQRSRGGVPAARRGRRPTLSLELVVGAALQVLDEAGEGALTFRALAARLETGVGSLYHYVSSKEELLDRAANEVLGEVLSRVELPAEPLEALRELAMTLYLTMQEHPWTGAYLLRDDGMQVNAMRLFELFGRQLMSLDLTPGQRLNAVSTLTSFVVGAGAELREVPASVRADGLTPQDYLQQVVVSWRELDPEEFPFVHSVIDDFAGHDDVLQFRAGVDLLLAGIVAQAGGAGAGDRSG